MRVMEQNYKDKHTLVWYCFTSNEGFKSSTMVCLTSNAKLSPSKRRAHCSVEGEFLTGFV